MRRCAVAVAVVISLSAAAVPVASAAVTAKPLLVQMGDSFASGVGAEPYEAKSKANECNRSQSSSYGANAARTLGYRFKNVACSGATTTAITAPFKGEAAQAAGARGASVVVISVGGNDVHVYDTLTRWPVGGEAAFYRDVSTLSTKLAPAFAAIKKAEPKARLVVAGYPDLFPADQAAFSACFSSLVGRVVDVAGLHAAMVRLNGEIAATAKAAGATFVPTSGLFRSHDVCSVSPWGNKLSLQTVLSSGALHPNVAGYAAIGGAVASVVRRRSVTPAKATTTTSLPARVVVGGMFVESVAVVDGWYPIAGPASTR